MSEPADVVMLLEGTYPYVRGGVSNWVHQIISNTPQHTFHLIYLGAHPDTHGEKRYEMPDNVIALDEHFLLYQEDVEFKPSRGDPKAFENWSKFQDYFHQPDQPVPEDLLEKLFKLLDTKDGLSRQDFLYSEWAWKSLANTYLKFYPDLPFTQFFWTYRNLYAPLFKLARIARTLPSAKLYHTVSTGYAGYLGAGGALLNDVPLLISEHGIYTKERFIDISQAEWIQEEAPLISHSLSRGMSDIRHIWIYFFEQLGITAYAEAARIISLYEGNRQRQLRDGAPEKKTAVIPNGIDINRFTAALDARDDTHIPQVAGLIGRVVPIKDIKTFIRAIVQARGSLPELEGWVIGPFDEDEGYYDECVQLVEAMGQSEHIRFLGMQNVADMLPKLGVTVLTSISEAQPLVLLECMSGGVPFVATDVGSCREIAIGLTPEDQDLGVAGEVVPIASPAKTAEAIVRLLGDQDRWRRYQAAGLERVRQIYDEQLMYQRYHELYRELMTWQA